MLNATGVNSSHGRQLGLSPITPSDRGRPCTTWRRRPAQAFPTRPASGLEAGLVEASVDVGEQGEGVEEVLAFLGGAEPGAVGPGVAVVAMDAEDEVLKAAVLADLGVVSQAGDRAHGGDGIGPESLVVERCPVAGELRVPPDAVGDALGGLADGVEEGLADEFFGAVEEERVVASAAAQFAEELPGDLRGLRQRRRGGAPGRAGPGG